jgi:hypothetical protein
VKIDISDEDMSAVVSSLSAMKIQEGEGDNSGCDSDSLQQQRFLSLEGNLASGKMGELLAYKMLTELLAGREDVNKVVWLNEKEEQGLPYDISIQYSSNKRLQKCEVKTHITNNALAPTATQWFISPQEVQAASVEARDYFCVFISATIEEDSGLLRQGNSQMVGFEHGLMNAIQAKDLSLIVQLNSNNSH